jgi:bifunctional non-homologous end joining protein LigD
MNDFRQYSPMLAQTGSKSDLTRKDWIFEPKLDGTRVLIYKYGKIIRLINRRGIDIAYRYPEIRPIENIKAEKAVLDGEIVVFDKKGRPDFSLLAEREHIISRLKIKLRAKIFPATVVVFDILNFEGKDLTNIPLIERKKILEKIIKENGRIKLCFWTKNGKALWKSVTKRKLEGVMAKQANSPYLFKRSDLWLKIKVLKSQDCVIAGWTSGLGRRGKFGSLILGAYKAGKFVYIGKVGSGFTEQEIEDILSKIKKLKTKKCPFEKFPKLDIEPERQIFWTAPELVCEVRYMHLSKQNIMRAPVFLRMRTDKPAKDCTLG